MRWIGCRDAPSSQSDPSDLTETVLATGFSQHYLSKLKKISNEITDLGDRETPEPVFIFSNLDSWLESSCHDFFSPEWDKWPLTIIRVTEYRTEPTWPWEDWLHYKLCYSALLYIRCPGDAIKPSLTFLTCSINTISDFYWIILFPPLLPPSFDIYFVPGSGRCISICCQNLWFSDKNCILKQFEEKLLKLHFTVCQMMFYKRMNLWVLREFFFLCPPLLEFFSDMWCKM